MSLLEIMRSFPADEWLRLATGLEMISQFSDITGEINESDRKLMLRTIGGVVSDCWEFHLPVSGKSAERMTKRLLDEKAPLTHRELAKMAEDLNTRIRDEIEGILFFSIDPTMSQYMQEPNLFGEDVTIRFPSATIDIEEAGRCLAFSRGTACVFHLMRVMETGLRVLAKSLNDPSLDPARNPSWESMLKKCRKELEQPIAERSEEWAKDDQFFSEATAQLMAVKNAWRNPTLHVQIVYDDEKAIDVWNSVRAFMRHLAMRLNEPAS
ncbi:MAG: hypothetical protein WBD55_01280 [Dehalococcoidia bacterium]